MPEPIVINEPIAAQRQVSVRLFDSAGNGVTGVTGATIKIALPGGTFATDGGCTLTEVTGGVDYGNYWLTFSANAVSTAGDVLWEVSAAGIDTQRGWVTVRPLQQELFYGQATAGTSGSVTLPASASATDSFYAGSGHNCVAFIVGGAGAQQARLATGYVGSSKVLAVTPNWATTPDGTSVVKLLPLHAQLDGSVITSIATGLLTSVLGNDGVRNRTVQGVLRRLDWLMTSKATGLLSAIAQYFMYDGTTVGIGTSQDTTAGSRTASATVTGD